MSLDYSKRDFLLSKGCKDLIDVIKLQKSAKSPSPGPVAPPSCQPPAIKGEILVSLGMSVGEFAALLGERPVRIIASLMQLGVFATAKQVMDFETMQRVARLYGYSARKRTE